MKKFLPSYAVVFLIMLATCLSANAQGIYQLWGATPYGGVDDAGVLFSTKYDGTGYAVKKQFPVTNPGQAYEGNKPVAYNNKLYSVLYYGGLGNYGVIAEFDPATNAWAKKADLHSIGAKHAFGSMVLYNGKLYGVSHHGGANGGGVIFEYNPANAALSVVHQFTNATGEACYAGMTLFGGKLYGTTVGGGLYDDGVLFEFNPTTYAYVKKIDFHQVNHGWVSSSVMVVYSGKLWGTFGHGGTNNDGTLYSYDPVNNVFSKKLDFPSAALKRPGQLTVLNDKLYGTGSSGQGFTVYGGLFEYNPATNDLISLREFSYTDGHYGISMNAYNGKLYGTSASGGTVFDGGGTIFSYNPVTATYKIEISLFGAIGTSPYGGFTMYNGKFYGFTSDSANYNRGSLFVYNPDENSYVSLVHLGGTGLRRPEGHLLHYNNKLYGTTTNGGTNQNGGIYQYDVASGVYTVKKDMTNVTGQAWNQGGMIAYNDKFYGVTPYGGINNAGALYEYDPSTNIYLKKHDFSNSTGNEPYGALTEYNGKLYGTCSNGSDNNAGNIYEYDPATGNYAQKVVLGGNFGSKPFGKLALYNNKLYGTCATGTGGNGTLFEYRPDINAFSKKADFSADFNFPRGSLTLYNNKFYGLSLFGGTTDSGAVYEYDPALVTLTKKADLTQATGQYAYNNLTVAHNKLVGLTSKGGANGEGTIVQYDPLTSSLVKKKDMEIETGRVAFANSLTAIPAPTAPGSPNSCINTQTININAANAHEWIAFTDAEGRAVAEINANGNILGNTAVRFYVNGDNIRQNGNGVFYLDRNITITPTTQPTTAVSVRLYIRKTEFDALKATAGSGVVVPADLGVFKNADFCAAALNTATTQLAAVQSTWGFDYVYSVETTSFSSFYFAKKTSGTLPIHILSFTGTKEGTSNKLNWKASCTNGVNFTIERSPDGVNFSPIGLVLATQPDCDYPFAFPDAAPLLKSWYRWQMKEDNGAISHSQTIVLDRTKAESSNLVVVPNPATGGITQLFITSTTNGPASISIIDVSGKVLVIKKVGLAVGKNTIPLETQNLAAGVYLVIVDNGQGKQATRFIKQ